MNKFIFVGRLTKDPEGRGQGENIAAVFTLAINRPYFNKDNIREADFIQIKAFRKLAENCLNWLQKGSMVAVEGAVRTGRYEKDGQQIYTTDFVADRVEFLAKTKEAPSNAQQPSANSQPFSTQQNPYYPVNGGYSRGDTASHKMTLAIHLLQMMTRSMVLGNKSTYQTTTCLSDERSSLSDSQSKRRSFVSSERLFYLLRLKMGD